MNDNYYQIDICFNFESDSDEKAIDYFLKTMTAANIPLKNAQLKNSKEIVSVILELIFIQIRMMKMTNEKYN